MLKFIDLNLNLKPALINVPLVINSVVCHANQGDHLVVLLKLVNVHNPQVDLELKGIILAKLHVNVKNF